MPAGAQRGLQQAELERIGRSDLRLFPMRTFPAEELVLFGGWLDVGLPELPFHTAQLAQHPRDERKPKVRFGLSDGLLSARFSSAASLSAATA
jgi:hypothetical protein